MWLCMFWLIDIYIYVVWFFERFYCSLKSQAKRKPIWLFVFAAILCISLCFCFKPWKQLCMETNGKTFVILSFFLTGYNLSSNLYSRLTLAVLTETQKLQYTWDSWKSWCCRTVLAHELVSMRIIEELREQYSQCFEFNPPFCVPRQVQAMRGRAPYRAAYKLFDLHESVMAKRKRLTSSSWSPYPSQKSFEVKISVKWISGLRR